MTVINLFKEPPCAFCGLDFDSGKTLLVKDPSILSGNRTLLEICWACLESEYLEMKRVLDIEKSDALVMQSQSEVFTND